MMSKAYGENAKSLKLRPIRGSSARLKTGNAKKRESMKTSDIDYNEQKPKQVTSKKANLSVSNARPGSSHI